MKKAGIAVVLLLGVMLVSGLACDISRDEYRRDGEDIELAIGAYKDHNQGELPVTNETITIAEGTFNIIDICKLKSSAPGLLPLVPGSCADAIPGNCDSGNCSCYTEGHYIWLVDETGDVYSTCVGDGCDAGGDGYQGVYP